MIDMRPSDMRLGERMRAVMSLLVCAFFALTSTAFAEKAVPTLTGQIVDQAKMMSTSGRANLLARLQAHEQKTGNQIAVLTVNSLEGDSLEQFSLRVARGWALGQKDVNNGVLFLIAKNDRKMRIEVGYGLEETLTDAIASFIIRQTVRPLFRKSQFNAGIEAGAGQIIEVLEADASLLQTWKDRAKKTKSNEDPTWPFFLFIALWAMIFFGSVVSNILVRQFGREIKPGHYRWLGMDAGPNAPRPKRSRSGSSGGGWSSGGGGFSGGGGGFGGGGSSGGW